MAQKKETEPQYNVKLEALEAFFVVQLIDASTVKGSEAERIGKLRIKFQKALDNHVAKTGEFVGYQPQEPEMVHTHNGV